MKKLLTFVAMGLPGFAVAVPMNYFLAAWGLPKPAAYALVLWTQVTINFFLFRAFVFKGNNAGPVSRQYLRFLSGIGAFRFLDWVIYSLLVEFFGLPFLLAQVMNGVAFSFFKFKFAESLFEGRRSAPR